MKGLIALIFIITFTACGGSIPQDSQTIAAKITTTHDSFKNQTWVETPLYLSSQGISDRFPVRLKFRALYINNNREFIQLYIIASGLEWGFYHSAYGQDGYQLEFNEIDRRVDSGGGLTTVIEDFAVTIPKDYLNKMTQSDWQLKIYGQRNQGVFNVPSSLALAFAEQLEKCEINHC